MMIPISVFFISAGVLALEMVLVRAFSIGHWHHFSYMVISTALLGFGAGGTVVTVFREFLAGNFQKSLWFFAAGFGLTVPVVFWLSQIVPFEELQLIWDNRQIVYLLACYLLYFVPFFFAGMFISLVFAKFAANAYRLYFFNMLGSGLGVAAAVTLMYGHSPQLLLLLISGVGFLTAVLLALKLSRIFLIVTVAVSAVSFLFFGRNDADVLKIRMSGNKALVYYSSLPGAETITNDYSPLGRLDCVKADGVRYFPGGFSLAYSGQIPEQVLIITDGDGISAVTRFRDFNDLQCCDYTTSALAYHLVNKPKVCVIGAGGGWEVLCALAGGAEKVTAVEMNDQVTELVRGKFGDFSGRLYHRDDVDVVLAEGRSFLQTSETKFDVINISLLESFSAAAAGLYALNESHLYTVEAISRALDRLRQGGLLCITRMIKEPPRDSIKMFATIVQALQSRGVAEPGRCVFMIRGLSTATIAVSPNPLSDTQIAEARDFASKRMFDLVHAPGIRPDEVNRFNVLDEDFYYSCVEKILSDDREWFFDDYVYNVQPATDDRPYFFDFFKWKSLPYMARSISGRWLPYTEWGYLVVVVTLLQSIVVSILFIILPLVVVKPIRQRHSGRMAAFLYFGLLGFCYMFLEMGFIQKLTLLTGKPVFGVAVTLLSFLVFSGIGSLLSERIFRVARTRILLAVICIIVIGIAETIFLRAGFEWLVGFSGSVRIAIGIVIAAPLAFFMGMPFPSGLKMLDSKAKVLVPWAWGVNGFASVAGAVLGTFLAISTGFTFLALIALTGYFLAGVVSGRLRA